jgi:hypothetical protein
MEWKRTGNGEENEYYYAATISTKAQALRRCQMGVGNVTN